MVEWFKATVLKIVNVNTFESSNLSTSVIYTKNMNNYKLEYLINKYLQSNFVKDNTINGLQIEGKKKIKIITTGVSINKKLIKKSIAYKTDAIITHHGLFWKKKISPIVGITKKRIKEILLHNINLYSWHIPLDIHPKIGNNIKLSNFFNIKNIINLPTQKFPVLIGYIKKQSFNNFYKSKIKNHIKNIFCLKNKTEIYKIGICSGAGCIFLEKTILNYNIDTYITGEINENTFNLIKEYKINYFSIGHYYSEILGIKSLGKWIKNFLHIKTKFININNPF